MMRRRVGMSGEAHRAPRWSWLPAGAPRGTHRRRSLGENGARSNAPSPSSAARSDWLMPPGRVPSSRRDQPRTAERSPTGEGISTPTAGPGPETKDLNTPSACPRCLQRATSIRSGSAPSWANLQGERINPLGRTRAEECPQVSRAGNTGKARQRCNCRPSLSLPHSPCKSHRQSVQYSSEKLTDTAARSASGYLRQRSRVSIRRSQSSSSRRFRALRVSSNAFLRQLTWLLRSRPFKG